MNNTVSIKLPQFRAIVTSELLDTAAPTSRWGAAPDSTKNYVHYLKAALVFPSIPQRLHVSGSKVRIQQINATKPSLAFPDFARLGLPTFEHTPEIADCPLHLSGSRSQGQLKYFYLNLPENWEWVIAANLKITSQEQADRFFLSKKGAANIQSVPQGDIKIFLHHKNPSTLYAAPLPNIHNSGSLCLGPGVPPLGQLVRSKGTYEGLLHWVYFWAQQRPNMDLTGSADCEFQSAFTPLQRVGNRRIVAKINEAKLLRMQPAFNRTEESYSWLT